MDKQNSYRKHRFPPANHLAAAIRDLPTPGPGALPQKVGINAGQMGSYRVTFIPRLNPAMQVPIWFWGIESSVQISAGTAEEC